jgi:hypothetical protein
VADALGRPHSADGWQQLLRAVTNCPFVHASIQMEFENLSRRFAAARNQDFDGAGQQTAELSFAELASNLIALVEGESGCMLSEVRVSQSLLSPLQHSRS